MRHLFVNVLRILNKINDVKDEKRKTAVFFTLVGGKTYNLLRNLASPGKPADLKFTDAIELLKNHFNPKPLLIAERYKFYQRRQETAENVAEYLSALRKCAEHCNFADFLQQALRDKFVCGLNTRGGTWIIFIRVRADLVLKPNPV